MKRDTRFALQSSSGAMVAWLALGLATSLEAQAQIRVPSEFEAGVNYDGVTHEIAFDSSGNALMATQHALYSYSSSSRTLTREAVAPNRTTQLALAPRGGIYAWLVHDQMPPGLFTVQLTEFPRQPVSELRLRQYPYGFSALYLGGAGQLIVTATPLNNPESHSGEFRYDFWHRSGRSIKTEILSGRHIGVVDPNGNAILLLGPSSAVAYDMNGEVLWRLDGKFRRAALSGNGQVALLNPSHRSEIGTVVVYANGSVSRAATSAPVHDLALSADGTIGAVALDKGQFHFIEPRSCHGAQCSLRVVPALRSGSTFFITDMRFVDPNTIAVATIERSGAGPTYAYRSGSVHVIDTSGHPVFDFPVALAQNSPGRPSIHATNGMRSVATHTPHRTLFLNLGP